MMSSPSPALSQTGSPAKYLTSDTPSKHDGSLQMLRSDAPAKQSHLKATNSSTKLIRTQAGVFAIMHSHQKTGYKEPMSETNARTLGAVTTYRQFHELGVELPTMAHKKKSATATYQPKLVVYEPGATCNRLPVKFENEPIPAIRFCAPRNCHQFDIGAKKYERRFLTHNTAFYPQWESLPIGFENGGVMSDFAARIHVSQNR